MRMPRGERGALVQHPRGDELRLHLLRGLGDHLAPHLRHPNALCAALDRQQGAVGQRVVGAGIIFIAGVVVLGTFQVTLILAADNREYAIAKLVNFFSQNNELVIMFGICLLTLTTGLAILLGRSPASLPKTLGWYSIVVAVVASLGRPRPSRSPSASRSGSSPRGSSSPPSSGVAHSPRRRRT